MSDEIVPKNGEIVSAEEMSGTYDEKVSEEPHVEQSGEQSHGAASDYEPGKTRYSMSEIKGTLRCMISFFTIIRLDVDQSHMNAMERNFWLSPVLGFLNGVVALIVCLILGMCGCNVFVQAVAALGSMYIFSKFLHFDGLTDFGDGMIVSSGKREDHIRALKDSLIGAGGFGVTLMVVLMTLACYIELGNGFYAKTESGKLISVGFLALCAEILVKNAQVAAAAFGEPGNGMASRQVRYTDTDSLLRSVLVTAILLAVAIVIGAIVIGHSSFHAEFAFGFIALLYIVAILVSVGVGYVMARTANKTFGFVNGDILGATNEISRVAVLFVTLMITGV